MNIHLLRHAESVENAVSAVRDAVPGYADLKAYIKAALQDATVAEQIQRGVWPAPEMLAIARQVRQVLDARLSRIAEADYDLSPTGVQQARTVGRHVKEMLADVDVVLHSPYLRTRRTLELLAEGCLGVQRARRLADERLLEKRTGPVKKDYISFFTLYPDELVRAQAIGAEYYYDYAPPQGESSRQVIARVRPFVDDLFEHYQGVNLLIVAHRVVLLAIVAIFEQKTARADFLQLDSPAQGIDLAGFSTCRIQHRQIIRVRYNQIQITIRVRFIINNAAHM